MVADDGTPLHVEVDEPERRARRPARKPKPPLTVIFAHGYALELDCWHFQREHYRGQRPHRLLRPALARPVRPLADRATPPSTSSAATC